MRYKDILNSFDIDRYCDAIWERLEIEQSLDDLEIGTKVKVKNKLLNITETLTVGRFNSNKVLIRDGLTCYNFNSDKYEILEIIKKERKEHKIEKERIWNKHKQKIRCHSSSVDNYFECEND